MSQRTSTTTEVTECVVESNLSSVQLSSESDTEMPVNLEPSDLGEQVQTLTTAACTAQSSLTTELAVDQTVNDLGALLLPSKTSAEINATMSKLSNSQRYSFLYNHIYVFNLLFIWL